MEFDKKGTKEDILYWAKRLYQKGMSPSTSGNISIKTKDGIMISASGCCLNDMDENDIILIDYEGNVKEGGRYTLQFMHGRGRTGHIVSIERVDGALQMYDPQSGKHYDKKQILSYLSSKSDMRLTRVDTMSFNPEYADHIMVAS